MLTLGAIPTSLVVVLSPGADFLCTLRAEVAGQPQDWPDGTAISLQIGAETWPAAIDANLASWNVDQDEVDAVLEAGTITARLWYENGDIRMLWAFGRTMARG